MHTWCWLRQLDKGKQAITEATPAPVELQGPATSLASVRAAGTAEGSDASASTC